jgi:hypothetical protein
MLGITLDAATLDEALSRAERESFSHLQFLDLEWSKILVTQSR